MRKAVKGFVITAGMALVMACSAFADEAPLRIAYQYGLAYAPLVVAQDQGFIEAAYKESTGEDLTVEWSQMNSGSDVNTALSADELDAGAIAISPVITAISKGISYRIFGSLSGQSHGLVTNDPDIQTLEDLANSDDQIALVTIGSLHHILLAKALKDNGLDPHALDDNLVSMKHPDGMASVQSGAIQCHLTSTPYIYMERDDENLHEITELSEEWPVENSYIIGVATQKLHDERPEVYAALCKGVSDAMDFINNNPEEAAAIMAELDGNDVDVELDYLKRGVYTMETKGVFEIAQFMAEVDYIDEAPASYEDLVFENVTGD